MTPDRFNLFVEWKQKTTSLNPDRFRFYHAINLNPKHSIYPIAVLAVLDSVDKNNIAVASRKSRLSNLYFCD